MKSCFIIYAKYDIWQKINKGVFIIAEAGKIYSIPGRKVRRGVSGKQKLVDEAAASGGMPLNFRHNVED